MSEQVLESSQVSKHMQEFDTIFQVNADKSEIKDAKASENFLKEDGVAFFEAFKQIQKAVDFETFFSAFARVWEIGNFKSFTIFLKYTLEELLRTIRTSKRTERNKDRFQCISHLLTTYPVKLPPKLYGDLLRLIAEFGTLKNHHQLWKAGVIFDKPEIWQTGYCDVLLKRPESEKKPIIDFLIAEGCGNPALLDEYKDYRESKFSPTREGWRLKNFLDIRDQKWEFDCWKSSVVKEFINLDIIPSDLRANVTSYLAQKEEYSSPEEGRSRQIAVIYCTELLWRLPPSPDPLVKHKFDLDKYKRDVEKHTVKNKYSSPMYFGPRFDKGSEGYSSFKTSAYYLLKAYTTAFILECESEIFADQLEAWSKIGINKKEKRRIWVEQVKQACFNDNYLNAKSEHAKLVIQKMHRNILSEITSAREVACAYITSFSKFLDKLDSLYFSKLSIFNTPAANEAIKQKYKQKVEDFVERSFAFSPSVKKRFYNLAAKSLTAEYKQFKKQDYDDSGLSRSKNYFNEVSTNTSSWFSRKAQDISAEAWRTQLPSLHLNPVASEE